jgi:hypothetical protein
MKERLIFSGLIAMRYDDEPSTLLSRFTPTTSLLYWDFTVPSNRYGKPQGVESEYILNKFEYCTVAQVRMAQLYRDTPAIQGRLNLCLLVLAKPSCI